MEFSREDIHNFATHHKLSWREDSSNNSTKYVRNNLRHTIIPLLKNLNPSFIESFQKTQNHLKDTQSILEDYMLEVEDRVIESIDENQIVYNIDQILSLNNPKAYLYQLLKVYNFTDWSQITALLEAQSGKQISSSTHRLLKNRSHLILTPLSDFSPSIHIPIEDSQIHLFRFQTNHFDLKLRNPFPPMGPASEKTFCIWILNLLAFPVDT